MRSQQTAHRALLYFIFLLFYCSSFRDFSLRQACLRLNKNLIAAQLRGTVNVTKPTGQLPCGNLSQVLYANTWCVSFHSKLSLDGMFLSSFHHTNKFLTYRFCLDRQLRLNVTLLHLYIPSMGTGQHCLSGFVAVSNWIVSVFHRVYYCGRLALISTYSISNNLRIFFESKVLVIIQAEIFFSILDKGDVQSLKRSTEIAKSQPELDYFLPRSKAKLLVHFLRTHPMNVIFVSHLNSTFQEAKAFDGPGIKPRQLRAKCCTNNSLYFLSSTFELMMYSVVPLPQKQRSLHFQGFLFSKPIDLKVDNTSKLSLKFPDHNNCQSSLFCLIKLKSPPGYRLNFTLTQFQYQGDRNTEDCRYAGIFILEAEDMTNTAQNIMEIYHGCVKQYYDTTYQHDCYNHFSRRHGHSYYYASNISTTQGSFPATTMNKFSTQNNALIAYYSFEEYGVISLATDISLTVCEVVHGDVCDPKSLENSIRVSKLLIHKDVPQFDYTFGRRERPEQSLSLTGKAKCVLFQLQAQFFRTPEESVRRCIHYLHAPFLPNVIGFAISVTGYLDGK